MFLIGLTGGIAAGKSTVAQLWESLGAEHIDADSLARDAVAPGSSTLTAIGEQLGNHLIKPSGELDRAATAALIFENPGLKARLEQIIHPEVRRLMTQKLAQLPADAIVVYNVPLLAEAASDLPFDRIVTVEAPVEKQIERMVASRGMTPDEARARILAQATPAERAAIADFILNSNQELPLLLKDARSLWQRLEREAKNKESIPNTGN